MYVWLEPCILRDPSKGSWVDGIYKITLAMVGVSGDCGCSCHEVHSMVRRGREDRGAEMLTRWLWLFFPFTQPVSVCVCDHQGARMPHIPKKRPSLFSARSKQIVK